MKSTNILSHHQLRLTQSRKMILNLFLKHNFAISQSEIEQQLPPNFDRVTVYRNLLTFEEKGIIHKVLDGSSQTKYALCHADCSHENHQDSHVHFKCGKCEKTFCLDEIALPDVKIPSGFQVNNLDVLLQGTCEKCS